MVDLTAEGRKPIRHRPLDDIGHGTHVSGITSSVEKSAKIMAIRMIPVEVELPIPGVSALLAAGGRPPPGRKHTAFAAGVGRQGRGVGHATRRWG